MTRDEQVTLTREQLYEQVWTTPMRHLAKQYGLSDVGLRKCCVRHDIPTPPIGYWAKKSFGHNPEQIPLPPNADPKLAVVRLGGPDSSTPAADAPMSATFFDADLGRLADAATVDSPSFKVRDTLRSPHPLVQKTHEALITSSRNRTNREEPLCHAVSKGSDWCIDVSVSKEQISRAMRILDAAVKGLVEHGAAIKGPRDNLEDTGCPRPAWRRFRDQDAGIQEPHRACSNGCRAGTSPDESPLSWRS